MPRAPNPKVSEAEELFLKGYKLIDISKELELPEGTIRRWKSTYKWGNERSNKNKTSVRKPRGAPKGNKNAVGNNGGAPKGNLNPLKHGAYQNIYLDHLPREEKALYEQMEAAINLESEIKLLRLKIARLLTRDKTIFYDMFGKKYDIDVKEEDRENGIVICMAQLEKLIRTQAAIIGDTEKLQLEKEKFDFKKYKDEIELQLKREKLELDKAKADNGEDSETEDDGFVDALKGEVDDIWQE